MGIFQGGVRVVRGEDAAEGESERFVAGTSSAAAADSPMHVKNKRKVVRESGIRVKASTVGTG